MPIWLVGSFRGFDDSSELLAERLAECHEIINWLLVSLICLFGFTDMAVFFD